jgi:hypothetical protein
MVFHAVAQANAGRAVIPCQDGKPLTPAGVGDASKDLGQILRRWIRWPDADIGIACGQASGLVVLEVMGEQGEAWLSEKLVPETRVIETPRGREYWFAIPSNGTVKSSTLAPGVNLRGDGDFVLSPPSIDPKTGRRLAFRNQLELAFAPCWLLEHEGDNQL